MTASPPAPSIAYWRGDRDTAFCLTFDDGTRDHYENALPLLAKHGLPATFFVIAGQTLDTPEEALNTEVPSGSFCWEWLREAAAAGHEIGNHSWSHAALAQLHTAAELEHEVNNAHDLITRKMGVPPLTFAYPYGNRNDHVLRIILQRHLAARAPRISYGGPDWSHQDASSQIEAWMQSRNYIVAMIHGIATGYNAFADVRAFDEHLAWLASRRDRLWIDTFATIIRYDHLREAALLQVIQRTATSLTLSLTCYLDERYDVPLTLIIPEVAASHATATQGNAQLPVVVEAERLLVDAIPGAGRVTIDWTPTA